jgi:hypothetical protein
MTPDTIRTLTSLRDQFYCLFSAAMEASVRVTHGNTSTNNPAMAFWVDDQQRLNYIRVYAHTAPDVLVPERPFVLRVSVNKGAGTPLATKQAKGCRGHNQSWHFELTVLPEELLDFVPWIVSVIKVQEKRSAAAAQTPPYPFTRQASAAFDKDAWTQNARQRVAMASKAV